MTITKAAFGAAFAVLLAGCGGTTTTVASTVTQTETMTVQPTVTETVTYTPPPPPGPKSTMVGDGTYVVGSDIVAGTYRSTGGSGCYWARLSSLSTNDIIDNNLSSGPQTVEIMPSDKAFLTKGCPSWQKVD
jgi:hypothetical protein